MILHVEHHNFLSFHHLEVAGDILCLSSVYIKEDGNESWKILAGVSSSAHQPACNQLVELEVPKKLLACKFWIKPWLVFVKERQLGILFKVAFISWILQDC